MSEVVSTIKYGKPAIKDLCTVGYNPLRCDVCQEKRKLDGKKTCGDEDCMHRYFEARVKPDTDETRTVK